MVKAPFRRVAGLRKPARTLRKKQVETRKKKPEPRGAFELAYFQRHLEHTLHRVERLIGEPGPPAIVSPMEALGSQAGPLVVTIGATIELEDLAEVPDDVLDDLESDIHVILADTMFNVIEEAKADVPVDKGILRDSIVGEADDDALSITFIADTEYARFVEEGTSRTPAQPFLRQNAENGEVQMQEAINDAIANRLEGSVAGNPEMPEMDSVDLEIEGDVELTTELVE